MFYSHSVLARKSPLGTVWIAAHLERKVISRTQIDGVDVPSYAESIMDPEVPIALRLSGHLLLGLVRIYSWKVNHLFQDCNRMLSAVRTAAAFVPAGAGIDLPSDADRAPFAAITLPATFSLDDAIRLIESPDNHRRPADEITLSGEAGYVMVTLDEDGSSSAACRSLRFDPEPHEEGAFPPFPEDTVSVDLPPPQPQDSFHTNGHQDSAEILRRATESATGFTDGGGSDPMDEDPQSPFMEKAITPPPMDSSLTPAGRGSPLPGASIPDVVPTVVTHDHDPMEEDKEPGGTGIVVPAAAFVLAPSPPPVQGNKRRRAQNPRIDEMGVVLSNDDMRSQVDGDELQRLVRRRKPLPHTALDTWKFNKRRQMDSLLPSIQGMCADLHRVYERNDPRVSDSDADVANIAQGDAPVPPVNADPPEPEPHLTPLSSQEPEHHLTPMSSGNGEATPFDTTPELPRFSLQMDLSPVREEDDSPFIKTPAGRNGTPGSGLGGTAATATATHGSYATPGQNTCESDPNGSQFPFGDHYLDEDLPQIPGLINTPSMTSGADTGGATGLSSMSTRTRAAAKYYKGMMMSSAASEDQQRGKFSLNIILDGRTRKQAASMFFETLALKSYDYIDVLQEEAYGDISVSVTPSLSSAKL